MKNWKKTVPAILFAIAGVVFLFAGLEERVIDGGPVRFNWLSLSFLYFAVGFVFFARGRKSGGGTKPPNA